MRGKNIYIACDLSTIGRSMSSGRIERNSSLKSYEATLLASRLSKAREKSRVDKCKWIRTIDDGHPLPGLALPVGHFVHLLRYISRGTFLGFDGRSVQQAAAATAAAAAAAHRAGRLTARSFSLSLSDVRTSGSNPGDHDTWNVQTRQVTRPSSKLKRLN